jgi:hypothetical protein
MVKTLKLCHYIVCLGLKEMCCNKVKWNISMLTERNGGQATVVLIYLRGDTIRRVALFSIIVTLFNAKLYTLA